MSSVHAHAMDGALKIIARRNAQQVTVRRCSLSSHTIAMLRLVHGPHAGGKSSVREATGCRAGTGTAVRAHYTASVRIPSFCAPCCNCTRLHAPVACSIAKVASQLSLLDGYHHQSTYRTERDRAGGDVRAPSDSAALQSGHPGAVFATATTSKLLASATGTAPAPAFDLNTEIQNDVKKFERMYRPVPSPRSRAVVALRVTAHANSALRLV